MQLDVYKRQEQASLAGMEELIAANEKKRAYFKEQEEHLKRQMEETESLVEYREYLQYQKLYDELLSLIHILCAGRVPGPS